MEKNPVVSKQRNDQWLMFNQLSASYGKTNHDSYRGTVD